MMHRVPKYFLAILSSLAFLSASLAQPTPRAKDFGRQWVRQHEMQIIGFCQIEATFDPAEFKAANLTTLLAWKPRAGLLGPGKEAGIPHFLHLYAKEGPTDEFKQRVAKIQKEYPGALGIIVNDEPNLKQMTPTRDAIAWIRTAYPECVVMSNAYPIGAESKEYAGEPKQDYSYSDYVVDYVRITDSDIVMFDIYPFSDGKGAGVSDVYFLNLKVIRDAAQKVNKPYWTFVQSYQTDNRRLPSESDLRMQFFSSLTYGFTGFAYFTYDVAFDRGLLEQDGRPNALYTHAAKVNLEISRLGKAMRHLTNTDVRFVQGTAATKVPPAVELLQQGANSIEAVTIANPTEENSGLVGFFKDDSGKAYFMLTNLHQDPEKNAEECKATFKIKFGPEVKTIWRLNRQTGKPESLPIESSSLAVTLEGGTGDLFKFDDASFPGLE